jgi:tRNA (guanine37-N1)-methyltransferase
VPDVLLSGDHARIAKWRYKQALGRSFLRRPDLVRKLKLNEEQQKLLDEFLRDERATAGCVDTGKVVPG